MHPDIQRLIDIARESGELTEKQKGIILRKAEKLGEDLDEVEILLETFFPTLVNKDTNRKKCPNCGAIITDVVMRCPECGYVFQKVTVTDSSEALFRLLNNTNSDKQKKQIIESFPIPNSKQDLLDFLLLSKPYLKDVKGVFAKAYFKKYAECIDRCKQFFPDDPDFIRFLKEYEEVTVLRKSKRQRTFKRIVIAAMLMAVAIVGYLTIPTLLNNRCIKEFSKQIETGNIKEASNFIEEAIQYRPNTVLSTLLTGLDSEYCSSDPSKADSILHLVFDYSLNDRIKTKGELWSIVEKVANYHVEIGDIYGKSDILELFDNCYPNDLDMLFYDVNTSLDLYLLGGVQEGVDATLWLASMIFDTAPESIRESTMKLFTDKVNNTKDYATLGCLFNTDGIVASVVPNSSAEANGVKVGDRLISQESEPIMKQQRIRAEEGRYYHHVFSRNGKEYSVDLQYKILPFNPKLHNN